MLTTREAAQLLERQDNILILTHRRPDGDTIGCAAGLCAALRLRGKEAYILPNPDVTAVNAVYAAPYWAPEGYEPSFVVSVDIAARSLFFPAAEVYFPRIGLAIDHHPSFEGFGAAQCVDSSRAACGEIVYEICRELGEVTAEVALPLYAGALAFFIWRLGRRLRPPLERLRAALDAQARGQRVEVGDCGGVQELQRIGRSLHPGQGLGICLSRRITIYQ